MRKTCVCPTFSPRAQPRAQHHLSSLSPFLSCPVLSLFSLPPPPLLLFAPKQPNKKSFRTFSSSRRKQPSASDLRFYFRRGIARVRYLPSASALPRLFFERVSKERRGIVINNFSRSKLRENYSKTNLENVNFFSRKISISERLYFARVRRAFKGGGGHCYVEGKVRLAG